MDPNLPYIYAQMYPTCQQQKVRYNSNVYMTNSNGEPIKGPNGSYIKNHSYLTGGRGNRKLSIWRTE